MTPGLTRGDGPRCAVVGAGGIGAFFGAQVPASRGQVVYCARRPFGRLRIESDVGAFDEPVRCLTEPASVPPEWAGIDWVFVAVKTQHTRTTAPWLERLCSPATRVLSLQNGIEQREILTPLINGAALLESAVYCGAEQREPGVVRQRGATRLLVDDVPDAVALERLFAGSCVAVERTTQFRTEAWRKLMVNAAANGITALTRKRIGVLQVPEVGELARAMMTEMLPLARADGAPLTEVDVERALTSLQAPASREATTSMYQDRLAGRDTEHDAIYGAVLRRAERLGTEAPLNRAVAALLTGAC